MAGATMIQGLQSKMALSALQAKGEYYSVDSQPLIKKFAQVPNWRVGASILYRVD